MKQLLIALLLVMLMATGTFAQESPIEPGSMIIGGNITYMTQGGDLYEYRGERSTTVTINPSIGRFVSEGVMVGGRLTVEHYSVGSYDYTNIGIGPMFGIYTDVISSKDDTKGSLYAYFKGSVLYMSYDSDVKGINLSGNLGLNYMLSDAVALDCGVLVGWDRVQHDQAITYVTGVTAVLGLGISAFVY